MTQLLRKLCLFGALASIGLALSNCKEAGPSEADSGVGTTATSGTQADAGLASAALAEDAGADAGAGDAGETMGAMDGGMAHLMPDGGMMPGMSMEGARDAGTVKRPKR